jgi:hypothetical protein|tara:strand:- start:195 stop:359 length:165 start_codon:yes stop_codon:yes gene_type:complete
MGVVKAFYGLAGSLLTAFYYAFFAADGQVPTILLVRARARARARVTVRVTARAS